VSIILRVSHIVPPFSRAEQYTGSVHERFLILPSCTADAERPRIKEDGKDTADVAMPKCCPVRGCLMPTLLVVEDEKKLLECLRCGLSDEGYEVLTASTGEEGFYRSMNDEVDVVVLDVMLPGRDGFQVLADLRKDGFTKPVLMLTARDAIEDRVRGLDSTTRRDIKSISRSAARR
jgi:CheY-like chemotaxis protein